MVLIPFSDYVYSVLTCTTETSPFMLSESDCLINIESKNPADLMITHSGVHFEMQVLA